MKAKKVAILMISATLTMGTAGAVSVLADPPAMGGEQFGGGPGGQDFSSEMPQAPSGQDFNDEMPQAPSEQDFNGEMPQAPSEQDFNSDASTDQSFNGEAPADQNSNSNTPQLPSGQVPNGQVPNGQTPGGQAPNGQPQDMQKPGSVVKITAIENGNATVEIRNMSEPTGKPEEMPTENTTENKTDLETKNYDFSSAEIVKESKGNRETASLSDITADSMVEIELNEDGTVKTVIIKERPDGQMPDGQAPNGQVPNGQAPSEQAPNGQAPETKNMVKVTSIDSSGVTVESRKMTSPEDQNFSEDSSETKKYDFSSAEIVKESNGKREAATLSDITTDSMIELELNDDGSVKTVIIREKPDGQIPNEQTINTSEGA